MTTAMTNNQTFPLRLPVTMGSIEAYISYVNQIPLLTHGEELLLAERLKEQNDLDAAKQLVMSHLRYVVRIARGYLGYGLSLNDLIQEGSVGLLKAVKRFNPQLGVRLVTFASHWIKAEIHEFILRNWRIVKVATTKAQRKLFFNLRSMKKHLGWLNDSEVNNVAADLNVKSKTVREMEMRLATTDPAFDAYDDDEEDHAAFAPAAYLEDHRSNPALQLEKTDWSQQSGSTIQEALGRLDKRSQEIISARWLDENKLTLQDLADKYQVSAERIRQLEKSALQKLRFALLHAEQCIDYT
jgi:RNA polymerase sigma-32 factor